MIYFSTFIISRFDILARASGREELISFLKVKILQSIPSNKSTEVEIVIE